jgi:RNA-directed DNA polymerase
MQNRIAEAYKLKDIKLVAKLQLILVSSFAARALAVKKVTTNQGSNTPGIDGMTWTSNVDK